MDWWQSHLGLGVQFCSWQTKQMSRNEFEYFHNEIRMISP
jgi:hypothetical protein